ncbi:MAG: 50S ribosomal protein L7/L12 [Candidatus Riesia sp.]|nr:50S ribosomal protein L7/L12 [Candidatus Riesia sp.]
MSIKNEDIINAIANMSVLDLVELTKEIEKKFNISADSLMASSTGSHGSTKEEESVKVEEKTIFTVEMTEFGSSKLNVIKTIRTILDLGLKEAKDFVESVPTVVKKDIPEAEAIKIKNMLEAAGAKVLIK